MWFGQIGFVWRIFLRLISGCFSFLVSQGLMGLKGILTRRELCGTNAPTPEALPLNPETEECSKALHGVFFRRKGFEFCERLIADKSPVVKFIHSKPPFLMTSWHHLTLKQWKVYAIAFFLQFDTGVGGSGAQAKKKKKKKNLVCSLCEDWDEMKFSIALWGSRDTGLLSAKQNRLITSCGHFFVWKEACFNPHTWSGTRWTFYWHQKRYIKVILC